MTDDSGLRHDLDAYAQETGERLPSLTHVVSTTQPIYFYYEVYEPAVVQAGSPKLLTSLTFFRGRTKVYETPLVEVTRLDAPDRKAAIFQYAVPASALLQAARALTTSATATDLAAVLRIALLRS